jgi:hypothetical protein
LSITSPLPSFPPLFYFDILLLWTLLYSIINYVGPDITS